MRRRIDINNISPTSGQPRTAGLFVTFIWLMSLVFLAPCGMAQTYNDAYQQYIKSDYPGAIATLGKVVKTAYDKEELGRAFKLLGIVHYMQGNKKGASAAFRMALRHDPNITVSQSEVLDETVVDFFVDQKTIAEDELLMKRMKEEERKGVPGGTSPPPAKSKGAAKTAGKAAGKTASIPPADDDAFEPGLSDKESGPKPKKTGKAPKFPTAKGMTAAKNKSKANNGEFSMIQLFPFGIGQFYNGSFILGALVGGAQIGSLLGVYMLGNNINKAIANSDAIQDDASYSQAEKDAAYNTATSFAKEKRTLQTYCYVGFAGLWAVGAIEAVIHGKKPSKTAGAWHITEDKTLAFTSLPTMNGDRLTLMPAMTLQVTLP